jgi:transcriptional regulator of acetoin/glycerol metabolism
VGDEKARTNRLSAEDLQAHKERLRRQAETKGTSLLFYTRDGVKVVESILFGHEKGAFSGASQRNKGVFETVDGGTVLLDEVGELPLPVQAALLRALENRCINRVGSSKEIPVDVRVLAATHQDLEAMCVRGAFRKDLLFRLNTMARQRARAAQRHRAGGGAHILLERHRAGGGAHILLERHRAGGGAHIL